jgi:DNA-directed RNA polymerase subunit RPC12/RpoP
MARVVLASSPWRTHATPALTGGMGSRLARVRRASAPCPPPHGRGKHATPTYNLVTWCEENFKRGLLKEYVDPDKGPTEVTYASTYKALWKCAACGYEWRATVTNRTKRDRPSGCPVCSRQVASSTNNFLVWCEENGERGKKLLEKYVDPDRGPTEVTYGSDYKALWKCAACDHEWRATVRDRTRSDKPRGCPACSGYAASSTNNFLVWCEENGERGKKLLEEYVDPDRGPTEVMRGSEYKAMWKCAACGHEWRAVMHSRTKSDKPSGCPACNRARRTAQSQSGRRVPPAATR